MQKQLQLAFFDAVKEQDVIDVATKLKEKALAGELPAIKLFLQFLMPQEKQVVQQAVVVHTEAGEPASVTRPVSMPTFLPRPTIHEPATNGKLAALEERAANGEDLFHPHDGSASADPSARQIIAFLLSKQGACEASAIAERTGLDQSIVDETLNHNLWFDRDPEGYWRITPTCRQEFFEE